ncbi:hypothetical protein D6D01_02696 [Aureobasidium pullulans]|uniref:DUF202 domain-containing protein n=1 Tax=Aureobasidium pullulans TaxID=5580 RepID=A0A4S9LQI0_AURPU|nr:hypothetical protein D6D01_02696 [Aureobasidium pullulans]
MSNPACCENTTIPEASIPNDNNSDEREATELGRLQHGFPIERSASIDTTSGNSNREPSTFDGLRRWWKHYIQLHVPHAECRDHLDTANERTFLAYQRTSLALSMLGIVTAQLFSLQHSQHPDPVFGYHALGRPLAALFQSAAIVVILIGGHRFWRQQMNMARGRVWAGGWEIWSIMAFMLLLLVFVFGLLIACDASV